MIIAVDFDGTIVEQGSAPYEDVDAPLRFLPGAKEGLTALRRAGHTLILYSARANKALCFNPFLDPLVRDGKKRPPGQSRWQNTIVNQARYRKMVEFVEAELPGVFASIDDGEQGKPSADLYVDDKALRFGEGPLSADWPAIAYMYGDEERRDARRS